MSAGPADAPAYIETGSLRIARTAVVTGTARFGEGSVLAEGAADKIPSGGFNLISSVLLSTLVGMRLPGRYATFTGFQLAFEQAIHRAGARHVFRDLFDDSFLRVRRFERQQLFNLLTDAIG